MSNGLKSRTLSALFWSLLERFGQQGIQFIISIILARLLLPEEFGLVAMLLIFMGIAQSFIDSGFGQALIQKQDVSHTDECSVFYFNIFMGFIAAGLLCVSAPWIADFYGQPLLVPLTYVLSLNMIINAFGLIQTSLLIKNIDFKTQLKVSIIAAIISGTIGITMAADGFGVWSLVVQSLGNNFLRTILLWFFTTWRPSLIFSLDSLRAMFAFGSRLLISGVLNTVFQNLYIVVIGRLFSPAALGFYSRAQRFQEFPVYNISNVVSRVTFPVFSSIQNDEILLKKGARKALTLLVMINFPIMVGLAIISKPLILLVLTEKWAPCIPYLQLLCVVGMLYPLHSINLNILKAKGRSDLFFRIEVIKKILVLIAIIATYRWGIMAMIFGQIVTSFFAYYLNSYYTGKLINYSMVEQVKDFIPSILFTSVMGVSIYALNYAPIFNQKVLLITQLLSGVVIYISLCCIARDNTFMEIIKMTKLELLRKL